MNTLFSIVSILLSIMVPVGYLIYIKKKYNYKFVFSSFIVGVVLFFICRSVINSIFNVRWSFLFESLTGYILLALVSALFYAIFYFVLSKFAYGDNFDKEDALNYSLGMALAEIIIGCLFSAISNLMYATMIANGSLESYLSGTYNAESIQIILDYYQNLPSLFYLSSGISSILILSHACFAGTYWLNNRNKPILFAGSMLLIEFVYIAIYLSLPQISYAIYIVVALILTAIQLLYSKKYFEKVIEG